MRSRGWTAALIGLAVACSDGDGDGNGGGGRDASGDEVGAGPDGGGAADAAEPSATGLSISPRAAELDVLFDDSAVFSALATFADAPARDVSAVATWAVEPPALGRMSGATFLPAGVAGTATVTASFGGQTARATVRLRLEAAVRVPPEPGQPSLPEDPVALFASATPSAEGAPRLVYPLDGVLLPPNLGTVDVHYRPGGYALFELSFVSAQIDVRFFTRCAPLEAGCRFDLDEALYTGIAEATAGRGPVQVRVRGVDEAGTRVGASDAISVAFAPDPVEGGLYYWASNAEAIIRVDFGAGNEPEVFFPFEPSNTCFGCHALSPNGERMSLSREGQNNGELYLLDVSSGELVLDGTTGDEEQFQTWSPDSERFAAIYGDDDRPDLHDEIRIRSGETGEILERIALGHEPTHPDWSSAGDRIAYTRVTRHQTSQRPGRGGLSYVEETPDGWSEPRELIAPADGLNYYNPAYAPGGEFLVFNRSVCPDGRNYASSCDADADPSAALFAMLADGGPMVRLDRANAGGPEDGDATELTNTFPRWAPFVGDRDAAGNGRIMWVTFSSRRAYGLHPLPDVNQSAPGQFMWMAAVDPDAILRGEDGSFPAFALPFQDLSTSNHIGQWTQRIVPVDPDPGGGGPGDAGPGDVCRGLGESCADDPCCAGLTCRGDPPVCRSNL